MIALSAIFVLIMNIIIFWNYSYIQKQNSDFTNLQLHLQKENDASRYYKMLLQQDENQKILIHDIKKHLQSIAILNQQNEFEKLSAYINEITNNFSFQNSVRVCDNELLNMILCRYIKVCEDNSISMRCDIRAESLGFVSDNDLTALFCNLLDNAVESASKMQNSFIELNVVCKKNTDITVITLINSCRINPFAKCSNRLMTSKADSSHHGYGLKSVERIARLYHGEMQLYYDDENMAFHSILLLKNKIP